MLDPDPQQVASWSDELPCSDLQAGAGQLDEDRVGAGHCQHQRGERHSRRQVRHQLH
jgi:hypothetical protein